MISIKKLLTKFERSYPSWSVRLSILLDPERYTYTLLAHNNYVNLLFIDLRCRIGSTDTAAGGTKAKE